MYWTKLNTTFDAEPNGPQPRVKVCGTSITVQFFLNSYIRDDIEEDDEAELTFHDTLMYRLGPTNDEGFYKGQCRFSATGIKWGEFYELAGSNWQRSFPTDRIVTGPALLEKPDLKHYLYYFRDETFECIAKGYEFQRLARKT